MCRETRSQLVWRHVHACVHRLRVSWPTLGTEVREQYLRLVDEPDRLVQFSDHRDAYARARNDAQTLRRFEHAYEHALWDYDLPADMEEAVVAALGALGYPEYHRLMVELAERYGMLAAYIPRDAADDDVVSVAAVLREVGEAVTAAAPLLEDCRIDHRDDPVALRTLQQQLLEAMGAIAKVEAKVAAALAQQQGLRAAL